MRCVHLFCFSHVFFYKILIKVYRGSLENIQFAKSSQSVNELFNLSNKSWHSGLLVHE